jgi:hypothetical protein
VPNDSQQPVTRHPIAIGTSELRKTSSFFRCFECVRARRAIDTEELQKNRINIGLLAHSPWRPLAYLSQKDCSTLNHSSRN